VNGCQPIAGRREQHASIPVGNRRGIALLTASSFHPEYFNGPNRKIQLLELCARIGFTPPVSSKLDEVFSSFDLLEVSPCLNNFRRNNSPS
jgi:hypothetical protein